MSERIILKELLTKQLKVLASTIHHLDYSYSKIHLIDLETSLTEDQYELFDSFSSRFLRLYEVLVNQVLRTELSIVNERKSTHLDNMNKAEQFGVDYLCGRY